jgi:hypothetical protein
LVVGDSNVAVTSFTHTQSSRGVDARLAQVAAHLAQKPWLDWQEAQLGTCESSSESLALEIAVVQKDWTDLPLLVVAVAAKALAEYHFLCASSG